MVRNVTISRILKAKTAFIAGIFVFSVGGAGATDRTWNGGTGGTEAEPLDIYVAGNWNPGGLPTTSDKLYFATTAPTVATNGLANGAATQISGDWFLNSGDWTFLGPAKFPSLEQTANSGSLSVVKKGDWTLTYAMYLCRSGNALCNIIDSKGREFKTEVIKVVVLGSGRGGNCVIVSLHYVVGFNLSVGQVKIGKLKNLL